MVKTAEFGQLCVAAPLPCKCRICGCTEDRACVTGGRPCGWADHTKTLCDNPACLAEARREIGR